MSELHIAAGTTFNLTSDYVGNIVFDGAGATLNGQGHVVYDPDGPIQQLDGSVGIYSQYADTTIKNVVVSGFGFGIEALGEHSTVDHSTVGDSQLIGITIGGNHSTASNDVVHDIGGHNIHVPKEHSDLAWATFGFMATGDDDTLVNDNTYYIHGTFFSDGYDITGTNSHMRDDLAQGVGATSWSIGMWSNYEVKVDHSNFTGLDIGIGNQAGAVVNNSTFNDYNDPIVNFARGSGGNTETHPLPDTHSYILGTTGHDNIIAGDNDNFIVADGGAGGAGDVVYSGKGHDIIAVSAADVLSALPDFEQGADKFNTHYWDHPGNVLTVGVYSVSPGPAFFFNPYDHVLMYDVDGREGAPAQEIAYFPYVTVLHPEDMFW